MSSNEKGWAWFGVSDSSQATDDLELARCFARVFRGGDGERALRYLKSMSVDQVLGPCASDAMLRHVEGQRQLVAHVQRLIERGRGNVDAS